MEKAIQKIKEVKLPFFGEIYNVFLFIEKIDKENKTIFVRLILPEELKFFEELIIFELKVIGKHYKKKIIVF